jgi:hypothetical protein
MDGRPSYVDHVAHSVTFSKMRSDIAHRAPWNPAVARFSPATTQILRQVCAVVVVFHARSKTGKLLGSDIPSSECKLFRTGDFRSLAPLNGVNELTDVEQ